MFDQYSRVIKYSVSPTQQTSKVFEKTFAYGNLGSSAVLATKGHELLKLIDLNEQGLLDDKESTKNFKKEEADLDGNKLDYISWA